MNNNWMEKFFGTTTLTKSSKSQEDINKDKLEKEELKKINTHNNKCFRKILISLYIRIFFIQWLFKECKFKGLNTIHFTNLNNLELNKICEKCRVWIDKVGMNYRWKESKAIEGLEECIEFMKQLYRNRHDEENNILHYSNIGNLLAIDLKALVCKSVAINAMTSKLLLSEDMVIKLHKYTVKLIHISEDYVNHINEILDYKEDVDEFIDINYNQIYSKLDKIASFNVILKSNNNCHES